MTVRDAIAVTRALPPRLVEFVHQLDLFDGIARYASHKVVEIVRVELLVRDPERHVVDAWRVAADWLKNIRSEFQ